jgi:hypothetical protein
MNITDDDLERVPIEQVQLGDTLVTKPLNLREPRAWQVEAKKTEWNEKDGQTVILRAAPQPGTKQAIGVKAAPGTLVHRIIRRR